MIYIIQAGTRGPFKIGYTRDEESLRARVNALQTSSPVRLAIRYAGDGSISQERRIHNVLRSDNMSGEWFKPSRVVRQFILVAHKKGTIGALAMIKEIRKAAALVEPRPRRYFTDEVLGKLETKGVNYRIYETGDSPGFGIQVTAIGTKIFFSQYTIKGKRRWLTLGRYPYVSLPEARDMWLKSRKLIHKGIDPQGSDVRTRHALRHTED